MSGARREVEVYLKTNDVNAVVALISSEIGALQAVASGIEGVRVYEHEAVSVFIQPSEDEFLSVWVRGSTSWPSSPALGMFLASRLRCIVRCDPEDEFPEVSPYSDLFLQLDGDSESLVPWG